MKKLVVLILIVAAVWYLFVRGEPNETVPTPTETAATEEAPTEANAPTEPPQASDFLAVATQQPGGTVVADATIRELEGYIVIHKNENDHPGVIVGASALLPAGTHKGVAIELTEPLEAGASYFAMIHVDDGDSNFSFPGGDMPLTDENDNIMQVQFAVAAPAAEATETTSETE